PGRSVPGARGVGISPVERRRGGRRGRADMTIRPNLPAWVEIAKANIRWQYMYRFNVFMGIVLTGVTIYLLTIVWRAAYGSETDVGGIGLQQTLVYLTIANLQLYFLRPEVSGDIQSRIRDGQIGFDLSRPVGY